MKTIKITSIVLALLIVSCTSRKTILLANGKRMSEKKFNKMIAKNVEEGLKELSSEDRDLILNSTIDTADYRNK